MSNTTNYHGWRRIRHTDRMDLVELLNPTIDGIDSTVAGKMDRPNGGATQLLNGQGIPVNTTATPISGSALPLASGGAFEALRGKADRASTALNAVVNPNDNRRVINIPDSALAPGGIYGSYDFLAVVFGNLSNVQTSNQTVIIPLSWLRSVPTTTQAQGVWIWRAGVGYGNMMHEVRVTVWKGGGVTALQMPVGINAGFDLRHAFCF